MVAKPQYVTDAKGRKKAVILPIRDYLKLLEDLHDLSVVASRRHEPTVSLEAVTARLTRDSLLPAPSDPFAEDWDCPEDTVYDRT